MTAGAAIGQSWTFDIGGYYVQDVETLEAGDRPASVNGAASVGARLCGASGCRLEAATTAGRHWERCPGWRTTRVGLFLVFGSEGGGGLLFDEARLTVNETTSYHLHMGILLPFRGAAASSPRRVWLALLGLAVFATLSPQAQAQSGTPPAVADQQTQPGYRIGSADVLKIIVWRSRTSPMRRSCASTA